MFEMLINEYPAVFWTGIALVVTMIATGIASVIADEF